MGRRKRIAPELSDFGTDIRLRRGLKTGRLVIEGEGRVRNARVVSVLESFPVEATREAQAIMQAFRQAQWQSYSLSNLQPKTGTAVRSHEPSTRAESARHYLWKMNKAIGRQHFAVLWGCLLLHLCQREVAVALGCQRRDVRGKLYDALCAASAWRRSRY